MIKTCTYECRENKNGKIYTRTRIIQYSVNGKPRGRPFTAIDEATLNSINADFSAKMSQSEVSRKYNLGITIIKRLFKEYKSKQNIVEVGTE